MLHKTGMTVLLADGRHGVAGSIGATPATKETPLFMAEEGAVADTVDTLCFYIDQHKVEIGNCTIRIDTRLTRKQTRRLLEGCAHLLNEIQHPPRKGRK